MTLTSETPTTARRPRARRKRSWAMVPALLYAALTLVALAAWLFVGDTWWSQPVNLTTFWWSLPAVPLSLVALVSRRPRVAAVLLVPASLWLWSYGTLFLPATGGEEASLRVATFNTYVHAPDAGHVLDLVATTEPDILVLQEVFHDRWDQLDAALSDRYQTRQWFESEGVGGVAVLSRFPMAGEPVTVGAGTRTSRATKVVTLDVEGRAVQIVPLHLISPCPTCGPSMLERLELEGAGRRAEISEVLDALDPTRPTIVAGDLNSTDRSDPYRTLTRAGFADPHRSAGSGPGFTWPNGEDLVGPFLRIDWVLTRGFVATDAFVPGGGPSDHRPVVVSLRFGEAS